MLSMVGSPWSRMAGRRHKLPETLGMSHATFYRRPKNLTR